MGFSVILRYAAPALADHDGDFSFVVQLPGLRHRAEQGLTMPEERRSKTREDAGVLRWRTTVLVFLVTMAVIHAYANDLAWHRNGRQQPHILKCIIARHAVDFRGNEIQLVLRQQCPYSGGRHLVREIDEIGR